MNEDIWPQEVGDPVENDNVEPDAYSEVKKYKHLTPGTTIIRWTKGEIVFLILVGISLISLIIFSIIRDAPHP